MQFSGVTFSNGGFTISPPPVTPPSPSNTVTASFSVSGWNQEITNTGTITGPAPLGVYFDATGTTCTDGSINTYRQLGYHFDFGYLTPTTPGTWQYSGSPRGNQIGGPLAAHIYETPGTYTASVRAQDQDGNYSDRSVTIVVQDPNDIYSGTSTVCVSLVGDFTGAPAGATTTTSVPASLSSNTRYLFKCGENFAGSTLVTSVTDSTDVVTLADATGFSVNDAVTFRGKVVGNIQPGKDKTYYVLSVSGNDITISATLGGAIFDIGYTGETPDLSLVPTKNQMSITQSRENIHISSFGTGAKPIINCEFRPQPTQNSNFTIRNVTTYNVESAKRITVSFGNYITFLDMQIYRDEGFYLGTTVQYYYGSPISNQDMSLCTWGKNIIIQELYNDSVFTDYGGFWLSTRYAVLGSTFENNQTHVLRTPFTYKGFIAHNYLGPVGDNVRAQIKAYGTGLDPFSYDLSVAIDPTAQYLLVADNYVAPDTNNWQMNYHPENAQSVNGCLDGIFERNYFDSDPAAAGSQKAITMGGNRICARDNEIAPRPASDPYGQDNHSGALPASAMSPYYLPPGSVDIDNVRVFPNDPTIIPAKASSVVTITYAITPDQTSVQEGDTVNFTVTTTNFGTGTLYWTVEAVSPTSSGSITIGDFTGSQVSGSVSITSNSGLFSLQLSNDLVTEGTEYFRLRLRTDSISGSIVATSSTISVSDISTISTQFTVSGWGQEVTNTGTITGPAPFAVFFDATETVAPGYDTFREAGYHFDFGYATPTTPGTWTYSSKPKGNQIGGPVAAHVYETPGTYTASVRAELPNGDYQDQTVTIVVVDPEVYWTTGGRTTTTIARSGLTVWPTWSSNTRYLLEAGEDYSTLASGTINLINVQNVCIGKTGVGADPIVTALRFNYTTGTTPPTGAKVIFSNLNSLGELNSPVSGNDCLFHQCAGSTFVTGTLIAGRYTANPSVTWYRPRRIFASECDFNGNSTVLPFCTQTYQLVMIGCTSTAPREHALRVQGAQYAFIGHNWLHDQSVAKHALTLRSTGIENVSAVINSITTLKPASRYIVAADNLLSDGAEVDPAWPLYIGPQNTTSVESLEYIIAERNIFNEITGSWAGYPVHAAVRGCRQITVRDDIYMESGRTTGTGNYNPNYGASPPEWTNGPLYSNTFLNAPDNIDDFSTPTGILPNKAGT